MGNSREDRQRDHPDETMDSEWNTSTDEVPGEMDGATDFERSLEALLFDAFAGGAPIEQTWDIPAPVSGAPGWRVNITRIETEREPNHVPDLLEE